MDPLSGNLPKSEHYCSVLISDLPQDWFLLEEDGKRDRLGNANILKISCCDASKRSAVVRVRESDAQAQRVVIPPATSAVVIENEKASLSLSLNNTRDKELFEQMVKQFNLEKHGPVGNMYTIIGSLDMIADFRLALEKKIMAARAGSPVATRDDNGGAAAIVDGARKNASISGATAAAGTLDNENAGASATGIGHPIDKTTSSDDTHGWNRLPDRFNFNTLLHMAAIVKPDGVKINLHDGTVLVDKRSKSNFYDMYDTLARQKIYSERLAIPVHMSIPYLLEELELLKLKHNKSGFVVMENSLEVCLVSTSTRQMDSFAVYVKDLLSGLSYQLPGGRVLKLLKRNIVTEDVDVIVNAANDRLDHGGGVAAAINNESGGEVQRYSNQLMKRRQYKSFKVGEVAITEAGGFLKCQKVFHAVGPEKSRHRDCQGILKKLVHTILSEAERLNLKSVALPAISTGIFGVSKDLVAQCFLSAIPNHRFKKIPPILGDIRIVIIDEPTFSCFRGHFQNMLLGGPVSVPFNKSKSVPVSGHSNDRDLPAVSYAAIASEGSDSERVKMSPAHDRRSHDLDSSKHHNERSRISPGKPEKEKDAKTHDHGSNVGTENRNVKGKGKSDDLKKDSNSDEVDGHKAPESCANKATSDTADSSGHDCSESSHTPGKTDSEDPTSKNGDNDGVFYDALGEGDLNKRPSEDPNNDKKVSVDRDPDVSPDEPPSPEPNITATKHQECSEEEVNVSLPYHIVASTCPSDHPPGIYSTAASSPSPSLLTTAMVAGTTHPSGLHQLSSTGILIDLNPVSAPLSLPDTSYSLAKASFPNSASAVTVRCCTCSSITVARQTGCFHSKCQDCSTVKYPCPVCFPELPVKITPKSSIISHSVLPASLSGYPVVSTIEIQFQFPDYLEGNYEYGTNKLSSYLPNNTEGREVLKLFLEAYAKQPMYSYYEAQGRFYVLMGHSYFKIYGDRGGLWGYPDEHYLARVKGYLESCLRKGMNK